MFAAISGLRVHQTMLDVTANNIANVNTIGFKGERTSFKDALSQTSRAASAPTAAGLGGTNAAQIGLGVQLSGIDNQMQSGAVQSTGSALDVAIQGDGFFRISDDLAALTDGAAATAPGNVMYTRSGNFTRDANGRLVTPEGYYVVGFAVDATTGAITPALPAANEIAITIPATAQAVSIGQDGVITTVDAAGTVTKVGAISMAKFPNDAGLERVSGNKFRFSNNSGTAGVDQPGAGGNGILIPGAIEMSNIDLAQEFTNMITAQRGFQANSRIISAADEMLTELVNLKR